jgi:DNA-directed RNA polymerase II subunit RPB1
MLGNRKRCYQEGVGEINVSASKIKKARVTNVRFGLLSSEEIAKLSAVEVKEIIINKSGIVHRGGVNDSAMGTTSRSMLCSTCSSEMKSCPGHMGHIVLGSPVLNIEFITHVLKILTCVCFYCSKLLFSSDHPKYETVMNIQSKKKRQHEIHSYCQKARTCSSFQELQARKKKKTGDSQMNVGLCTEIIESEEGCGGLQPLYVKDDILIRAIFTMDESMVIAIQNGEMEAPIFTPEKMFQILRHISPSDVTKLGMDPIHSHPSSMLWKNLVVPPVVMRPSRSKSNNTKIGGEDDLTIRLRGIVKSNLLYNESVSDGQRVNLARYSHRSVIYRNVQDMLLETKAVVELIPSKKLKTPWLLYLELQRLVAGYQDNKYQNKATDGSEYGRDKKSVRDRFTGQKAKKGRMRHTIFGKRQNYSSRTVITPSSSMDIDEVGVPKWICMKLTYPERVNSFNIHELTGMVRNGPKIHPGANYVIDTKGKVTSLKLINKSMIQLEYGWIVRRHLKNGDDVLFNRQPSLHKMSLMAHRVRVVTGNSFLLHMAVTKPYNADFDGDEMNLQVVMDELSRAEARCLLSVRHNMVKDTVPLVCFQQHTVASAYLLSRPDVMMSKSDAFQLLYQNKNFNLEKIPSPTLVDKNGDELYSGLSVFSACLPSKMYVKYKGVLVVQGVMLRGRLNGDTLNKGILYTIWKDFGCDAACDFISGMQLLLEYYLNVVGLTVGPDDCYMKLPEDVKAKVQTAMNYVESFDHNPTDTGKSSEMIENNICLVLDKARDLVGDYVLNTIQTGRDRNNGLYEMIESGAKGNDTNMVQIAGLVGQQRNHHSMRMSDVTSHFKTGINKGSSHGMICRSFYRGLRPNEYFNHLVGSRVGLVDTAVKTSETGLIFPRMFMCFSFHACRL